MSALEWQVAEGSLTAHVLDAEKPRPKRGEHGHRSGPRALCKAYPRRNAGPWFSLPVADFPSRPPYPLNIKKCADCADALAAAPPAAPDRGGRL